MLTNQKFFVLHILYYAYLKCILFLFQVSNFKYWILQIAKHLAINYHNRVINKEKNVEE